MPTNIVACWQNYFIEVTILCKEPDYNDDLIQFFLQRRRNQFNYLGLEADRSLIKKWDEEKRIQKMAERGNWSIALYM